MNKLKENFESLLAFAKECNFHGTFITVGFVEEKDVQFVVKTGLTRIPRNCIFNFEDFENRFEELFDYGHSWINLYLAGIIEDTLLILIEVPQYKNNVPREFVSVNFSLPIKRIADNNWNLIPFYEIIE